MSTSNRLRKFVSDRDWRIWFGLVITFFWIGGGLWFVISSVKADPNQELTLGVIGNFLEGAFAPLAFLWLVLGLFMQQRELANNTEMLRRTSEQSEKQTRAIAATEMNARQETFFKIAESVKHQLGGITGMLFAGGLGPVGSNRYSRDEIADMFQKASSGDTEIFAREFMSMEYLEEGGIGSLLYDSDIRRRHTRNYRPGAVMWTASLWTRSINRDSACCISARPTTCRTTSGRRNRRPARISPARPRHRRHRRRRSRSRYSPRRSAVRCIWGGRICSRAPT